MPRINVEVIGSAIPKLPLTVTADNTYIGVGESAPRYTATYDGFTDGDTPDDLDGQLTFESDYTKGDGLGLPICRQMAMRMNGDLDIDSEFTKGIRFVLSLQM